jgi:vitamin B12 transporter
MRVPYQQCILHSPFFIFGMLWVETHNNMKKKFVFVAAGLGLAQLALVSMAAHAQQDTATVLGDVVIKATKVDQKQSQTGKVVTIITRQQLERSSGKNVAQLLNEQANIMVNGANGNPGLNKSVYTRGADNKHTLILLDGIMVNDPSNLGGAFDLRLLAIDQIDHIEILKGGQSTLYGSDAVAGVINIVTKKGAGLLPSISGVASAGSYGTARGSLGVAAQVNDFSYNLNYTHERSDGVSEAARPDTATRYFDKDGYSQNALNAQFGISVSSRLKINPFGRYLEGNYKYDDGGFTDAAINTFASKHLNLGTNVAYQLNKGLINLNYSYENTKRSYTDVYGASQYIGRLNFADLYFNHQIGEHVKVLVGVDNRYSQMNVQGTAKLDSNSNLFGAYGSVFLNNLGKVFNLEAGGRYNNQSEYGSNWTYSVTPTFNLLPQYQLKVFGTISTSFKSPDLSALFGQFGANPDLKPERSNSYEAGASTALFDNMFKLRVVAYKRKVKDAIIYLYPQGYLNQDLQNVKGIEIEPSVTLGKLTVNAYYTYLKANTTTFNATGLALEQDYLLRRPKHSVGIFAGLQATEKMYVSVNYRNYGKRTDSFYNSATFANELQPLKSYNLVDAYAEYNLLNKRLKVFADVKNIFNEKNYELYGYTALGTNFNAGVSFNIR